MAKRIKELELDNETRTLLHTEVGNELIKAINNLLNMEFSPPGIAKLTVADDKIVMTIDAAVAAGGGTTQEIIVLKYSGGSVTSRRMSGVFTDNGAYTG